MSPLITLVKNQVAAEDFSKSRSQILTVQTVRMAFLAIMLSVTVIYQVVNASFIPYNLFFSVYSLLLCSFILNCLYVVFLDTFIRNEFATAILFIWEAIYITLLIHFVNISQSLLVFLYLVNIILCGIIFQRRGGVYLSILTSVLFSLVLALDRQIVGNALYLAVGVNNLAFFTVAYLSGYLSEQINFMGSELRERSKDIRLLKNLNTLVLDSMSTGLLTVDKAGNILQHNPKLNRIVGVPGSLVGKNAEEIMPWLMPMLSGIDKSPEQEISFKKESGDICNLRVRVSALENELKQKKGSVLVVEDVSQFKKLQSRLRQSEKMAAIGQLSAGIAHEIRNPLASISGSVQLLQTDIDSSEENQKLMSIMLREIDRLNNLITEFLDYASPTLMELISLDINQLIKEVVSGFQKNNLSNQLKITTKLTGELLVRGNHDKLTQALLNLLLNAAQASEDGQEIVVSTSVKEDFAVISIRDNGAGIAVENLERIFEPFHTSKSKGTGLGLSVVHSIIDAHGGGIEVESELERGTEFIIQLPVSKKEVQ